MRLSPVLQALTRLRRPSDRDDSYEDFMGISPRLWHSNRRDTEGGRSAGFHPFDSPMDILAGRDRRQSPRAGVPARLLREEPAARVAVDFTAPLHPLQ